MRDATKPTLFRFRPISLLVTVVVVAAILGSGCVQEAVTEPGNPGSTPTAPGYVYRPATSESGPHAVLFFRLAEEEQLLVPVTRRVEGGEPVRQMSQTVSQLLAGPGPDSGLNGDAGDGDSSVAGVSIEDDQVYIVLTGSRPSDSFLEALYPSLVMEGYRSVSVFWEQDIVGEWGTGGEGEIDPMVNVLDDSPNLQVYLPLITSTSDSRRLYLAPFGVSSASGLPGAVQYVFEAVAEPGLTDEPMLKDRVPALFSNAAPAPGVSVNGSRATIDFSSATVAAYSGGPAGEAALLDALTFTVTGYPSVDEVAYTVDGSQVTHLFTDVKQTLIRQRPLQLNPE